uniref:Ribonuclease G n=1 Tax=Desulfatirhabdium butyrativorans TaxID=340467 RepID=A0A7C4MP00_9BACT
MYKKLVINATEYETRVALLEDGTIAELFIQRHNDSDIAGNIYKGRIQRVLPGMQAAFVDIGLEQAAFLYVDDIIGSRPSLQEPTLFKESEEEDLEEPPVSLAAVSKDDEKRKGIPIEDLVTEGQEILVHVAKSPIGSKGARVTTYVSLPGRFLVMMPFTDHIGISRRITDEAERNRLKEMVLSLRTEPFGYIVRTASEGVQAEKLANEMVFLKNLWEAIQTRYKTNAAPSLIHRELNVSLRAVRDLLTHEADKLIIDNPVVYETVQNFLDRFMPFMKDSVELYQGMEPIFDAFNLEGDILRALKKKVWLKSGGYIVIEETEALVAIDVNTGRYVGKHNLEETILKTNLEAVKEIAYQLRLRDIGGIIIIDFIDMEKKANQEKVYNALIEALRKDRSKTHVLPMSEIGLIQMTRKRIRQSLNRVLCEPCFYCEGEGFILSKQSVCHMIFREILSEYREKDTRKITVHVHPEVAELLHREENHLIVKLEKETGKPIVIYPNERFHVEQYEIIEMMQEG